MKTNLSEEINAGVATISAPPRFGRLLGSICRQWRRQVDISFKELDLSDATRMPLLVLLEYQSPMRQKDMAQALGLDTSSLVRVLDQLRERGLLDWASDPMDRRTKCITLTPEGRKIAGQILDKSLHIEHAILADLTPQELVAIRGMLQKISQRIDAL